MVFSSLCHRRPICTAISRICRKKQRSTPRDLPAGFPTKSGGIVLKAEVHHPEIFNHYPSRRLPGYENILLRDSYLSSVSRRTKIPNWVAERVTQAGVDTPLARSDFADDPDMPLKWRSQNSDFFESHYSKGHLAAAGLHKDSPLRSKQTFFLSGNILPQDQSNNACDWYRLENLTRRFAKCCDEVFVVSGPMWLPKNMSMRELKNWNTPNLVPKKAVASEPKNGPPRSTFAPKVTANGGHGANGGQLEKRRLVEYDTIGRNQIHAPTHLWKVVVAAGYRPERHKENLTKPWEHLDHGAMMQMGRCTISAFIMENHPQNEYKHLSEFEVPVEAIEHLAGLDLEGLVGYCERKMKVRRSSDGSEDASVEAEQRRKFLEKLSLCGITGVRCNDEYVLHDNRLKSARLLGEIASAKSISELEKTWTSTRDAFENDKFLEKAYRGRLCTLKDPPAVIPKTTYFNSRNHNGGGHRPSTPTKSAQKSVAAPAPQAAAKAA